MPLQTFEGRPDHADSERLAAPLHDTRGLLTAPRVGIPIAQVHREVRSQHPQATEFSAHPALKHGLTGPEVVG